MKMYRIYDSKAEAYDMPVCFRTDGEAIRDAQVAANQEGSRFKLHAADYTLFCVGEVEPDSPEIVPITPKALINMLELMNSMPEGEEVYNQTHMGNGVVKVEAD